MHTCTYNCALFASVSASYGAIEILFMCAFMYCCIYVLCMCAMCMHAWMRTRSLFADPTCMSWVSYLLRESDAWWITDCWMHGFVTTGSPRRFGDSCLQSSSCASHESSIHWDTTWLACLRVSWVSTNAAGLMTDEGRNAAPLRAVYRYGFLNFWNNSNSLLGRTVRECSRRRFWVGLLGSQLFYGFCQNMQRLL